MSFMGDVLEDYVAAHDAVEVASYNSESRRFPIYRTNANGGTLGLMQAPVGAAAAAIALETLIGLGAKAVVACGGCGVLSEIEPGEVLVPTSALRDEGVSYHYLAPAREVAVLPAAVSAIIKALEQRGVAYRKCKAWTTDALFRETADMVAYRKAEGYDVVDMECAALASVANFRGVAFGQLFYSGDTLAAPDGHDHRNWMQNLPARNALLLLCIEAASLLVQESC
jgi:uridine phosphorylase